MIARSGPGGALAGSVSLRAARPLRRLLPRLLVAARQNPNCLTWVVLKAHTNNTAGRGHAAQSADPRVPADINFRYFDEGNDARGETSRPWRQASAWHESSRRRSRSRTHRTRGTPGDDVTDDQLPEFVRDRAWGHHASCTCRIGPEDGGVLFFFFFFFFISEIVVGFFFFFFFFLD